MFSSIQSRRENPFINPVFDSLEKQLLCESILFCSATDQIMSAVTLRGLSEQGPSPYLQWRIKDFPGYWTAIKQGQPVRYRGVTNRDGAMPLVIKNYRELSDSMQESLVIPIIDNKAVNGLLQLGRTGDNPFTEQDIRIAQSLVQDSIPSLNAGVIYARTLQQAAVAQILFEVQLSLAGVSDPDSIGQMIVDRARGLVTSRFAILSWGRGQRFCSSCAQGLGVQSPDYAEQVEKAQSLAEEAMKTSTATRGTLSVADGTSPAGSEPAAMVAIPFKTEARVTGALVVAEIWPIIIAKEEEHILSMLAATASVALENARTLGQTRYLAALEERQRLSREVHDQLAQDLVYLKMRARMALDKASIEGAGETLSVLTTLIDALNETYVQVRKVIFDLRHPLNSTASFADGLRTYLAEFSDRYGIAGVLEMEPNWQPRWSTEIETQVVRIIQEALSNVRQHANSCHVWVRLSHRAGYNCIQIVDDGVGFDPARLEHSNGDHFGLEIMQDRAQSIGGRVELESAPGQGTTLTINVPAGN